MLFICNVLQILQYSDAREKYQYSTLYVHALCNGNVMITFKK